MVMRVITTAVILITVAFAKEQHKNRAPTVSHHSRVVSDMNQHFRGRRIQSSEDPCAAGINQFLAIDSFYPLDFLSEQCSCVYENALSDVEVDEMDLGEPAENPNFWADLVTFMNDLISGLTYTYSNACAQSDCVTCIGDACGVIAAKESIVVEGAEDSNLTLTDVFALLPALQEATASSNATDEEIVEAANENVTALALLFGPHLFTRNIIEYCMEFNSASPYDGEACLKVDNKMDGEILTSFSTDSQDCTLMYNGGVCTGCTFVDGKCVMADCTGVAGVSGMVDSCAGIGLTGPFQILDASLTTRTDCNGDAPVVATTDAPVVAPKTKAPTASPVVAPTETPVVAPTEAPVVAPTEAPVVAPTEAPVMTMTTGATAPTEAPVVVEAPTDAFVIGATDESTDAPTSPTEDRSLSGARLQSSQGLLPAALVGIIVAAVL